MEGRTAHAVRFTPRSTVYRSPAAGAGGRALHLPLIASTAALAILGVALVFIEPRLLPVLALAAGATVVMSRRLRAGDGLQIDQMDRLRQAELALAAAKSTEDAARELAEHAIALLGAPSAVVLIEGI